MASSFVPRATFAVSSSITRSYFLGHHAGALSSMRNMLNNVDLVLDLRDGRVPFTSNNPLLEKSIAGKSRIIVYTKSDLCAPVGKNRWLEKQERSLAQLHKDTTPPGTEVVFTDKADKKDLRHLLDLIRTRAIAADSLTGIRALVVGMPNAGKSTLLNRLRNSGVGGSRAARVADHPGTTRSIATPVRIINGDEAAGIGQGVYVIDTPGVFIPYVSDPEAMVKLSLVGCVKDGLVPVEIVADYLLYHLNRQDPSLYAHLCPEPTNDAHEFLAKVATRTGKLGKGGLPSIEAAATWVVQRWRHGELGRFRLDDISDETLARARRRALLGGGEDDGDDAPISMNQARKRQKEERKTRNAAKRAAAAAGQASGSSAKPAAA